MSSVLRLRGKKKLYHKEFKLHTEEFFVNQIVCTNSYGIKWYIMGVFATNENLVFFYLYEAFFANSYSIPERTDTENYLLNHEVLSCEPNWISSLNHHCFVWRQWKGNEMHLSCCLCFEKWTTLPLKTAISTLFIWSFTPFKKGNYGIK